MKNLRNISNEVWIAVPDFEGFYEVSNTGKVRSLDRDVWCKSSYRFIKGRMLKLWKDTRGYPQIYLCKNGKTKPVSVHRIVMLSFVGEDKNKPTVNHKNGILDDNRLENLEWCTQKENNRHAYRKGLMKPCNGIKHPKAKLNPTKVKDIRNLHTLGTSQAELSRKFKVSAATIAQVIYRQTWKDVE